MLTPRKGILEILPYVPGKSSIEGKNKPTKLSANESALGPSPKALLAFREAGSSLHLYPDGTSIELREALGLANRLDPERIVCGAGSDELLYNLARGYAGPGDEILFGEHGFNVYPIVAHCVGAKPVKVPEKNLTFDVDETLARVTNRTRIVFIANPNNPTGSYISGEELARLRAGLREDILLVIDCAYAEFVTSADYNIGFDLVDGGENTVVTRTFSKIYALASLRIGWAYCPSSIADVLNRLRAPFNLSTASQLAAKAAVEDVAHITTARDHNMVWLPWLKERLTECGLTPYPSAANFLLVRFPDDPAHNSQSAMAFFGSKGFILRETKIYGLPECLRVTVGKEEAMKALDVIAKEFMAK
jgi:histidinol-phosphate aminotransferase